MTDCLYKLIGLLLIQAALCSLCLLAGCGGEPRSATPKRVVRDDINLAIWIEEIEGVEYVIAVKKGTGGIAITRHDSRPEDTE